MLSTIRFFKNYKFMDSLGREWKFDTKHEYLMPSLDAIHWNFYAMHLLWVDNTFEMSSRYQGGDKVTLCLTGTLNELLGWTAIIEYLHNNVEEVNVVVPNSALELFTYNPSINHLYAYPLDVRLIDHTEMILCEREFNEEWGDCLVGEETHKCAEQIGLEPKDFSLKVYLSQSGINYWNEFLSGRMSVAGQYLPKNDKPIMLMPLGSTRKSNSMNPDQTFYLAERLADNFRIIITGTSEQQDWYQLRQHEAYYDAYYTAHHNENIVFIKNFDSLRGYIGLAYVVDCIVTPDTLAARLGEAFGKPMIIYGSSDIGFWHYTEGVKYSFGCCGDCTDNCPKTKGFCLKIISGDMEKFAGVIKESLKVERLKQEFIFSGDESDEVKVLTELGSVPKVFSFTPDLIVSWLLNAPEKAMIYTMGDNEKFLPYVELQSTFNDQYFNYEIYSYGNKTVYRFLRDINEKQFVEFFDFIYVDGDSYEAIKRNSYIALEIIKPSGTIAWSGYGVNEDMTRVLKELAQNHTIHLVEDTTIAIRRMD